MGAGSQHATGAAALSVDGVSVDLGGRRVLHDVRAALEGGSFVGLIGPNGSGKSTLLRAIMGLVAMRAGTVKFQGRPIKNLTAQELAQGVAYLAQAHDLAWPMDVEAIVGLGRAPYQTGFSGQSAEDVAAVDAAISAMGLEGFRRRAATALSGGERARVLIARTLAQETPVLLADEPTAGLDPAHQIALMETFKRLSQSGKTVLASLHDLSLASQWCDRVLVLHDGRISADGAPRDVLQPELLRKVYGIEAVISETERGPIVVPTGLVAGARGGTLLD